MNELPNNLLRDLDREIGSARELLTRLKPASDTDKLLFYHLRLACEIGVASRLVIEHQLPRAAFVLARVLFESCVSACWISRSAQNAQAASTASLQELTRLLRNSLDAGIAVLRDRVTDELAPRDAVQEIVRNAQRAPSVWQMAKDVGLGSTYVALYGVLSMGAHGNTFATDAAFDADGALTVSSETAASLLEAIALVAGDWILRERITDMAEVQRILQVHPFELQGGRR